MAKQASRVVLDNGTEPPAPALAESHASDMDYFIGQLQIILPVLGVDVIRVREHKSTPAVVGEARVSPVFRLLNKKLGVDARAQQIDGEFTMVAGSSVVADWQGVGKADSTIRADQSCRAAHQKLLADGSIAVTVGIGRLAKDLVFGSPSTAGGLLLTAGRATAGRRGYLRTAPPSGSGRAAVLRDRRGLGIHP